MVRGDRKQAFRCMKFSLVDPVAQDRRGTNNQRPAISQLLRVVGWFGPWIHEDQGQYLRKYYNRQVAQCNTRHLQGLAQTHIIGEYPPT